jgi:CBS domain-containing protein
MKKFHTKKLPVIQGKSIVGIITITDISFAKPEMAKEFMDTYVTPRWID